MSSRAHARRRLAAWDRYLRQWAGHHVHLGSGDFRWWMRANRHRPGPWRRP